MRALLLRDRVSPLPRAQRSLWPPMRSCSSGSIPQGSARGRSQSDMEAAIAPREACGINRAYLNGLPLECEMASTSYWSRYGGCMQAAVIMHAADAVVGDRLAPVLRGEAHSNLLVPFITLLQQRSSRRFKGWPSDCLMQYALSIELGWSRSRL